MLEQADRPLSPREIHEGARIEVPSLGTATVYRTVNALVQEGELAVVELPGEAARYELAGKPHHHHFHCRRCDRVFEVPGCAVGRVEGAPPGFRVEDHEVVFYGQCGECARDGR